MNSKAPVIIGSVFVSYLIFAAIFMYFYQPSVTDMDWEERQTYNQKFLTQLSLGQEIELVRSKFGAADFSEAKTSHNKQIVVLFYRTHHTKGDGKTTRDECTPLLFIDNKLVAWGTDTYQQYLEAPVTI
ncbi:MAG: DUF3192 domain-containing protein [Parashewanella sp.]